MRSLSGRFIRDNSAATAIEYGLVAALLAIMVLAAFAVMTPQISPLFQGVTDSLQSVGAGDEGAGES